MSEESPLPSPPESYSDEERSAWRDGAASMARVLGSHALTLAGGLDDRPTQEDGPEECPECGADLVDAFGGARCLACDYRMDT